MTKNIVHDAQSKLNEDNLIFQGKDDTYYILFFVIKAYKKRFMWYIVEKASMEELKTFKQS